MKTTAMERLTVFVLAAMIAAPKTPSPKTKATNDKKR